MLQNACAHPTVFIICYPQPFPHGWVAPPRGPTSAAVKPVSRHWACARVRGAGIGIQPSPPAGRVRFCRLMERHLPLARIKAPGSRGAAATGRRGQARSAGTGARPARLARPTGPRRQAAHLTTSRPSGWGSRSRTSRPTTKDVPFHIRRVPTSSDIRQTADLIRCHSPTCYLEATRYS